MRVSFFEFEGSDTTGKSTQNQKLDKAPIMNIV